MSTFLQIILLFLFLALLGLHCCSGFSLVACGGGGGGTYSLVAMCGLLIAVTFLVEQRLWDAWVSVAMVRRLNSCGFWTLEHRLNSCGTWA